MRIGIIGAMDVEISCLLEQLDDKKNESVYGFDFTVGRMFGYETVIVKCGVGKVNAARGTQLMIDRYSPDIIINTGIAGAIGPEIDVGDVVISESLVQYDVDATALGYAKGYLFTGISPDKPTVFTADPDVSQKLFLAAKKIVSGNTVRKGIIASGDIFVSSLELKKAIRSEFCAEVAEMEGAAIAHVAKYCGIPFSVLRTASDRADGSAAVSIKDFGEVTARRSAAIVEEFIRSL